jgi:hypothetical protein
VFRENQHPDENERAELARRLGITGKQVKFWFQNRRSSVKVEIYIILLHLGLFNKVACVWLA